MTDGAAAAAGRRHTEHVSGFISYKHHSCARALPNLNLQYKLHADSQTFTVGSGAAVLFSQRLPKAVTPGGGMICTFPIKLSIVKELLHN